MPQTITTPSHEVEIDDDGHVRIMTREEPSMRITSYDEEGEPVVQVLPRAAMFKGVTRRTHPDAIICAATGGGCFVNIDCGVQRWIGHVSSRDAGKALARAGLDAAQRRTALAAMRRHPKDHASAIRCR